MFHDDQIKEESERQRFHAAYGRMADTSDTCIRTYLHVMGEVQKALHATGKDTHPVTLMMMFDVAESLDGVSLLIRAGSAKNCPQLLRTAFEISLGLRYIWKDDDAACVRRSLASEYYQHWYDLRWAQKYDPDLEEGKRIQARLKNDEMGDLFDAEARNLDVKRRVKETERLMNLDRYADVRAEIDRMKQKAKSEGRRLKAAGLNWYSLWDGPEEIERLAESVGWLGMYEILYRTWSASSHGQNPLRRLSSPAGKHMINVDPLRSPRDLPQIARHACNLANLMTTWLVQKFVPDQMNFWQDQYLTHIKPGLTFIDKVKMNG